MKSKTSYPKLIVISGTALSLILASSPALAAAARNRASYAPTAIESTYEPGTDTSRSLESPGAVRPNTRTQRSFKRNK